MLIELRIRNFAIIESLTLPLGRGFNVLSGETGAGKSIIVGALGLLLGDRTSADVIRTGADRATVEGVFEIGDRADIHAALDERGIDADEPQIVLKREIVAAGRARAWINGTTVTAGVLADVGRRLVTVHGQHEAQSLLDADSQRRILDAFAGASGDVQAVGGAHLALARIRAEITDLARRRSDAERRADYLRHVAEEIEGARLVDGEDVRLEDDARRLENAEELRELSSALSGAIESDDDALLTRLSGIERLLSSMQRHDPSMERVQELYDAAYYNLEALGRELSAYGSAVELDPSRLGEVRARRDVLFRLTKKYGPSVSEVIATGRDARAELDLVDSGALDLRQLEARECEARALLDQIAAVLTVKRTRAAKQLSDAVDRVLPELGMSDGHVFLALQPLREVSAEGAESVELLVAFNAGHEARPLSRIASGGELSRVMLALTTILARLDDVPTLIFDEVDAGIGGRVGLQVGETMRRVAAEHQVFAITHLAQIAARAHRHIVVSKGARGGITTADVCQVEGEARVREVARMLGGDADSDVSRAHAQELLDTAATVEASPSRGGRAPRRAARGA